uniref:Uncharacterized protein n=1 Tax=Arundo donax TaxID=35708 RepID=A0A0A9EXN5_ARUDO
MQSAEYSTHKFLAR